MKLRHPKSAITQFGDSKAPARTWRSKFTQWIYFAIVGFIILYAIYYFVYMRFYFIQRGLVQVNHVVVASVRGGRILKIPVSVGEHVKKGRLLMRVDSPNDCRQGDGVGIVLALKGKNSLDRVKRDALKQQMKLKNNDLKRLRYRRSMELYSEQGIKLQALQDKLLALQGDIKLLNQQIAVRNKEIKRLSGLGVHHNGCSDEFVRAPADGTIIAINHAPFEVLQRTEPVMDFIKDNAPVSLIMTLNNDYYDSLTLNEKVDVYFPDGSVGKGFISKIQSTAIPFPIRDSAHYLPERTRVLATIEPLESEDLNHWRAFNEVEVEVRGWR